MLVCFFYQNLKANKMVEKDKGFHWADWLIISFYFVFTIGIGLVVSICCAHTVYHDILVLTVYYDTFQNKLKDSLTVIFSLTL